MDIGKILIISGVILVILGVLAQIGGNFTPPRLPGDIYIKRDNVTIYFPWVTTLLISIILTIILRLLNK